MSSRRNFLKAGAAAGGLAVFAASAATTGERVAEGLFGEKKTNGIRGRSLPPEFAVAADGTLAVDPNQQVSYTMCMGCCTQCGVRVRVDKTSQTVTRVAGNPYNPLSTNPHLPYATSVRDSFIGLSQHDDRGLDGRSTACGRGNSILTQMTSPYRITQPLKRVGPRNSGRWEPISFEQLVQEVVEGGDLFGEGHVDGLRALRDLTTPIDPDQPDLGPVANQFAFLTSTDTGRLSFAARFVHDSFGSINLTGHGSFCGGSYRAGSGALLGDTKRMPHAKPDIANAEFVIFIGTAPGNAGNPFKLEGAQIATARTKGHIDYVVIDPLLTNSDSRAVRDRNRWVPIRPGTDGAFAMAMIRWIVENERYNAHYLAQPSAKAAEAAGEASWCNATHLVVVEEGHPRQGFFLRGSDLGLPVAEADRYKDADPFLVIAEDTDALIPHTAATGPARLFVDRTVDVGGRQVRVRSSLDLLRQSAMAASPASYAETCGIPAATIEALAREFTSHGRLAAIDSHGGTMAGNGFYNAFAILSLNALIGNLNVKGGTVFNGGGFKQLEGPRYRLQGFPGAVKASGTPLSRNIPYEKSSEFKRKKADGKPYPAEQPWFAIAPQLSTEWLPAAANGYPYPVRALMMWNCNPVYGIPGANLVAQKTLGDPKTIPLVIAVDAFINESTCFADYIVPDSGMYESWGLVPAWAGVPTKAVITRWPVVEPRQAKDAAGQPVCFETFCIAIARSLNLPGFGDAGIVAANGSPVPLNRPEDYYLRAVANLAYLGKAPVADASDDDIALSGVERLKADLTGTLTDEEWRKAAYVLARGGRFQNAAEAYDGDRTVNRYPKPLHLYNETVGTARDSMTGRRLSGVPAWVPPTFADGTPVRTRYSRADWPFDIISYKSPLQNSYSIAAKRLLGLHPDNPVSINSEDAKRLGLKTGDAIRLVSPDGAVPAVALVRDGVMPGVVAIEHGFGHREHGARPHRIGQSWQPTDSALAAGINMNELGIRDPSRKGLSLYVDPVAGTAVRQGVPVRVEKI